MLANLQNLFNFFIIQATATGGDLKSTLCEKHYKTKGGLARHTNAKHSKEAEPDLTNTVEKLDMSTLKSLITDALTVINATSKNYVKSYQTTRFLLMIIYTMK